MNTVGRIGQPRRVSGAPNTEVATQALNLLIAIGSGSKQTRRLVSDLEAAVAHNQRLVGEATEKLRALDDLLRREADLIVRQSEVDRVLAETKTEAGRLEGLKEEVAEVQRREDAVALREKKATAMDASLQAKHAKLQTALQGLT